MKTQHFILIITTTISLCSCSFLSKKTSTNDPEYTGLTLIQTGKRINITESTTELTIKKTGFTLEFEVAPYNPKKKKFHTVQIAATTNKENLNFFQEADIKSDNPFYSPGTGIASERNKPYPAMYIGESGHHYIYYKDDIDKRADVLFKRKNNMVRLKWDIKKLSINKAEDVKINKATIKKFYIMVFIDSNLNKSIDTGEYHLLTVNFE